MPPFARKLPPPDRMFRIEMCRPAFGMDLRAGPSTTERGTWPRPIRREVLAGSSSSRAHDDGRLRLPPASPPHKSEAGKKNQRATASTNFASRAPRYRPPHHSTKSSAMFTDAGGCWNRSLKPIYRQNSTPTVLGKMLNRRWSRWKSGCSAAAWKSLTPTSRTTSGASPMPSYYSR